MHDDPPYDSDDAQDLNLSTHRAQESVWDKRGWDGWMEPTLTRWLVGMGGGVLAAEGLRRRGASGGFLVALGGGLVWWALANEGDLTRARRWLDGVLDRVSRRPADVVHVASADSFPASDPPSSFSTSSPEPVVRKQRTAL